MHKFGNLEVLVSLKHVAETYRCCVICVEKMTSIVCFEYACVSLAVLKDLNQGPGQRSFSARLKMCLFAERAMVTLWGRGTLI